MTVRGMTTPEHITSCSVNYCLYAYDWAYKGQLPAILRISPLNGNLIKTWDVIEHGGCLSVASDTNVILNINHEAILHEYTADGDLIRKINVGLGTGIIRTWHAVKLPSGLFVVCHGAEADPWNRVCLLSVKSTTNTVGGLDEVEIMKSLGEALGESTSTFVGPSYLSVNKKGSILVTNILNSRAVLISSNLDAPQILTSDELGMLLPRRTCFDESTGQWIVADYRTFVMCRPKELHI